MRFPNKCVRCGFCCIAECCHVGQLVHNIGKYDDCPSLSFDENGVASCDLVEKNLVPVDDGCCIKARAFKDGSEYDFASLPIEMKLRVAQDTLNKKKD